MQFKCLKCNKIISRDVRERLTKHNLTKRGLKTYCVKTGKDVVARRIKDKR